MSASQLPTARRTRNPGGARAPTSRQQDLALGRYRLHRRLGAGGFGTVWEARDERLDRDVAVKILPRERIVGGRFEREARAAARLSHPGIVTLYEAAVDDDGAYLVSELVRGATLDQLLQAGRLSDRDVLVIGIALCDALTHAHAHGVIHRDVKPSNILVPARPTTAAQTAKLTDFGVARVIGGDSLTLTGDVIGTAAYMAPEQAEGREAGAAADLYSLSVVLYESLTGINPIPASTAAQRARRLGAHLPPLRRQRRELPRELGAGIDLALRPRPRERGSLEELRLALSVATAQVEDRPGVVAAPWRSPRRADQTSGEADADVFSEPGPAPRPEAPRDPAEEARAAAPAAPWSARAVGSLATALMVAWLAVHMHLPTAVAPALAAFVSAVVVLFFPRAGWLVTLLALATAAIAGQRPGAALLVTVAMIIPLALLTRDPIAWPLGAGAPALGLLGLGGAWPAIAGRAREAWRRAALGAVGWVWLVLAGPLAGEDLYLRRARGTPSPDVWTASLHQAAAHVLGPVVSSGVLAAAPVWALGAAVLPWIVRGRSVRADAVGAIVWAGAVVSITGLVLGAVHASAGGLPRKELIGAIASVAIALMPSVASGWSSLRESRAGLP